MNVPRECGRIAWPIKLGANPFGDTSAIKRNTIRTARKSNMHFSRGQTRHYGTKFLPQARKCTIAAGVCLASGHHTLEFGLRRPGKCDWNRHADWHDAAEVRRAH